MRDDVYLHELNAKLEGIQALVDFWSQTRAVCEDLHFATVEMYFEDKYFEAKLSAVVSECDWQMTLPLGERGYLRLSRSSEDAPPQMMFRALSCLRLAIATRERRVLRPVLRFPDAA